MEILKQRISKKGFKVALVKKESFGIDIFYKNGKLSAFYDFKNYKEAKNIYDNGLIEKYK